MCLLIASPPNGLILALPLPVGIIGVASNAGSKPVEVGQILLTDEHCT